VLQDIPHRKSLLFYLLTFRSTKKQTSGTSDVTSSRTRLIINSCEILGVEQNECASSEPQPPLGDGMQAANRQKKVQKQITAVANRYSLLPITQTHTLRGRRKGRIS
jgi:hypothetical protein